MPKQVVEVICIYIPTLKLHQTCTCMQVISIVLLLLNYNIRECSNKIMRINNIISVTAVNKSY